MKKMFEVLFKISGEKYEIIDKLMTKRGVKPETKKDGNVCYVVQTSDSFYLGKQLNKLGIQYNVSALQ